MRVEQKQIDRSFSDMSELDDGFISPTVRCVLFSLDNEVYGINVKKIREVLKVGQVRKVPGSSPTVVGVINVRGVIVTVVDTRVIYGIGSKPVDSQTRIIIVEINEDQSVGLLVDQVKEVKDIPESKVDLMVGRDATSTHIQGIAHFQGEVIILVDIENMFAAM